MRKLTGWLDFSSWTFLDRTSPGGIPSFADMVATVMLTNGPLAPLILTSYINIEVHFVDKQLSAHTAMVVEEADSLP